MSLMRWSPISEMGRMRDEMDRMMEQFFGPTEHREVPAISAWTPSVDVYECNGDVVIEAELPGVKPDQVDVSVQDSTLTIRGEMKREEEKREEGYLRHERHFGRFVRSIALPTPVKSDQAKATFQEGVLCVTLPKAQEEARGKKIPVESKS